MKTFFLFHEKCFHLLVDNTNWLNFNVSLLDYMVISDIYFSWETITEFECAYQLHYGKQGSLKYMIYSLRGFLHWTLANTVDKDIPLSV